MLICNYNRFNETRAILKYKLTETNLQYLNRQFRVMSDNLVFNYTTFSGSSNWVKEIQEYAHWKHTHGKNISFEALIRDLGHDCDVSLQKIIIKNGKG